MIAPLFPRGDRSMTSKYASGVCGRVVIPASSSYTGSYSRENDSSTRRASG